MTLVNQENAGGIVATKGIPDYTLWEKPAVVPVLDQLPSVCLLHLQPCPLTFF